MVYPIPAGLRNGYFLDVLSSTGSIRTVYCKTLENLVQSVRQEMWLLREESSPWALVSNEGAQRKACLRLKAYSYRDKALDMESLLRQRPTQRFWRSCYPPHHYTKRRGAVAGIRKARGGSCFKNCATTPERRLNAAWLPQEGEVECRVIRRENNLPNSRDGRIRSTERCWKSQHKGRKSWDCYGRKA